MLSEGERQGARMRCPRPSRGDAATQTRGRAPPSFHFGGHVPCYDYSTLRLWHESNEA